MDPPHPVPFSGRRRPKVASQSTLGASRKPALTSYDMATGDKQRSVDLTRNPHALALTAKYAWAMCGDGLVVRMRRSDLAVDSLALAIKGSDPHPFYHLAADDGAVWLANVNEGFIHIDPETLAEVGRMTFTNPSVNKVEALALADGKPWALLGGTSFRLLQIDAAKLEPAATLGLGQNPADPDGARVSGRTGYGAMAVSGTQALVYAYADKKMIRVDLAGAKVSSLWKADWIRYESLRVNGSLMMRGYGDGFMIANTDSLWVRRLGLSGTTHAQMDVKHYVSRAAARADGLMAMAYASGGDIGEVALARGASMDTVESVKFTWEQAALGLE